ncbi:LTXXQ motif family protein [Prosthecobacter fusiformis]|uniref:LTXXQ motif family protein n=1 Tax=Prosthecobacter fusiformis TaxID=48464 RepID=A0A4R7RRG4_9BACT|nr:Spy/CpxP family protein refolding chaperone [Prosthecobacter fusiformis]TDU68151.1 LTXXQ motif family protein [Prosthecobacter fusiformis]
MRLAFLFLVLVTCGFAAGPESWLQNGLLTPEMIAMIKPELALTLEQENAMNKIAATARDEAAPLEQKVREEQKAFGQILRQPGSTSEVAAAALTRLMEAEAEVKHLQLRTLLNLRDVLSPEQQKKAVALVPARQAKRSDQETRLREKAARLKAAVEALGVPATAGMVQRGLEVESLVREGDLAAAGAALDRLFIDSQVDKPEEAEPLDFSSFAPGDTDIETLRQRYQAVEAAAQSVISIHLLRQLIQARKALEQAKADEDVIAVGRILSWAEKVLKL